MIDEIIAILVRNNNKRNNFEKKLEEYGTKDERIIQLLFSAFVKEYGGYDTYTEDLIELMGECGRSKLNKKMLLKLNLLCTRKRRQFFVDKFNKLSQTYDKITAFIQAIESIEKEIKKTGNLK